MTFNHQLSLALLTLLTACTPASVPTTNLLGADRDAHGCIPSAGYSWCQRTGQCERPWELAAKEGFKRDADEFNKYCGNPGR
ncbi:MAG: hypothetical protein K8S22_08435 [Betaproteobacteria bacterium]|nr:hypothetical protein [Betaproteobacteria bacterium]